MVRHALRTAVDAGSLRVVLGLLLVAYVTLTTVKHLAATYSPTVLRVTESGNVGALVATAVFAIGWYLVASGVFRGVERAVERGRRNSP